MWYNGKWMKRGGDERAPRQDPDHFNSTWLGSLMMRLKPTVILAFAIFAFPWGPGVAQSPLNKHFGEPADPSVWPISAVGRINLPGDARYRSTIEWCNGTLVGANLVLTSAQCVDDYSGQPTDIHFLTGIKRGVPSEHSIAKSVLISPLYRSPDPGANLKAPAGSEPAVEDIKRVKDDWAIVVLKDPLPVRPISVRSLNVSQLATAAPFMHVGYGSDRPFLPSIVRNCKVDAYDDQTLIHWCLSFAGYAGAPILAQFDGIYSVIGMATISDFVAKGYACPAVQFEGAVAALSK
jgi:V8-like Glu-specific endopeptidase